MASLSTKKIEYLEKLVERFKALNQKTEQQLVLVTLAEKLKNSTLSSDESKALKVLLNAQKALEKSLEAQQEVRAILNQQQEQKRKEETRKKILIGSLILHNIENGKGGYTMEKLVSALDDFLSKEQDRKLFGLGTKNANQ